MKGAAEGLEPGDCAGQGTNLCSSELEGPDLSRDPQFCSLTLDSAGHISAGLIYHLFGTVPSAEELFLDALVSDLSFCFLFFTAALSVPRT